MADTAILSASPEVLVEFLNTLDQRTFARHRQRHEPQEELGSPDALARWLAERALLGTSGVHRARPTADDLADALVVRAALRKILVSALDDSGGADSGDNGKGATPPTTTTSPVTASTIPAALTTAAADGDLRMLTAFPLYLVADPPRGLTLACAPPRPGPVSRALATLVAAAATAGVRGTWDRIRVCAAPDCRWAFIDASRRGDKRWCSTAVCGNRSKTAGYRVRQRESQSSP